MRTERIYKKLFKIPEEKKLIPAFFALLLVMSLLDFSAILFTALVLVTIVISIKLIGLKFNTRRVLFLTMLISLLGFVSLKAFGSFSGSFFLLLTVFHFCSERGLLPSVLVSSIPFLILEPFSAPIIMISAFLFFLYLRSLNWGLDLNLREYVESFVRFWLTNDPRALERTLAKDSELFEGRVRCMKIGDVKLISTDFHPGPFRNLGGSKLIELIDSPDSLYLHSPSTHTRDPATEEDVMIIKNALRCSSEKIVAMKPFTIEGKNFSVFCFPFDKIKLLFVSGKKRIDDFIVNSPNFVVDCHNANFYGELSEEEVEEIAELVDRAEKIESERTDLKYGFLKIYFSSDSIVNYVAVLLLDYGTAKFAIVVFDSNNVELEFREKVEQKFSQIGYKTIVCSTDNHLKTGTKVRESYKPAGACREDYEVLDKLLEKCKKLELTKAELSYSETKVEVRVLGKILETLKKVEERANLYITVLFLLIFTNLFLPIAKLI